MIIAESFLVGYSRDSDQMVFFSAGPSWRNLCAAEPDLQTLATEAVSLAPGDLRGAERLTRRLRQIFALSRRPALDDPASYEVAHRHIFAGPPSRRRGVPYRSTRR